MAHTLYDNFYLSNEVADMLDSKLDLNRFVNVDNTLVGTAGMKRVINRYTASGEAEVLGMGEGNTQDIQVTMTPVEYEIKMAQNRFPYFDEQVMQDPMVVPVGMKKQSAILYNKINADIYGEFAKTTQEVEVDQFDFDAFVDAGAELGLENLEDVFKFAFVCPLDVAEIRKNMKETIQYVKEFAYEGYVGTCGDYHIYTKANATQGTIVTGTKDAVTVFHKTGVETEQERDANTRENKIYSRKYYIVALTDETKAVKIKKKTA